MNPLLSSGPSFLCFQSVLIRQSSLLLDLVCGAYMRALVACYTALTGCRLKSDESQKIRSSQRFIYHGSGAGVTVKRLQVETVLAGSWRYVQNTSKLESVREVLQCRLLVEWLASETGRL